MPRSPSSCLSSSGVSHIVHAIPGEEAEAMMLLDVYLPLEYLSSVSNVTCAC